MQHIYLIIAIIAVLALGIYFIFRKAPEKYAITASCQPSCSANPCGGNDSCNGVCPTTSVFDTGIKWTFINGAFTYTDLDSQPNLDLLTGLLYHTYSNGLYFSATVALSGAPIGWQGRLSNILVYDNIPGGYVDYTGLGGYNSQTVFNFDQNTNRYISNSAYFFPNTCAAGVTISPTGPLDFKTYEEKSLVLTTVTATNQIGTTTPVPIFRSTFCTNPTVLKTVLSPSTFSDSIIYTSTSPSLASFSSDPENLIYIELIGPLIAGFTYVDKGKFAPLSSSASFQVIPMVENKIFYIYSKLDISLDLYVYNNTSGVTQWYSIKRIGGSLTLIANTDTKYLLNNTYISQGAGLALNNPFLAKTKAIYISPEIFIQGKATDPENMIAIYNTGTARTTYFGSIYQALLCTADPLNLASIMTNNSSLLPTGVAPKLQQVVLDYTCFVIGLVGNLSAGFSQPDKNGNFNPASRFKVPGCEVEAVFDAFGKPLFLVLKHTKTSFADFGSIPPTSLYVYDNISGILQIFTLSRSISQSGPVVGPGSFTPITVNPATITAEFPYMSNIFAIPSPTLTNFAPQYLYIGPPIPATVVNFSPPVSTPAPVLPDPEANPVLDPSNVPQCIEQNYIDPANSKGRRLTEADLVQSNNLDPATFDSTLNIAQIVDIISKENDSNLPAAPPVTSSTPVLRESFGEAPSEVTINIPPIFNLKSVFPTQIEVSRNQGKCGSCWALSSVSILGDRLALKYGLECPYPSSLWLISACLDPYSNIYYKSMCGGDPPNGCQGGLPYIALDWLTNYGFTKLEKCWPYSLLLKLSKLEPDNPYKQIKFIKDTRADNCCLSCCPPQNHIEELTASVKFRIEEVTQILTKKKWGDYTETEITNLQNALKIEIMCKGTVLSSIAVTSEFQKWLLDFQDPLVGAFPVFIPRNTNDSGIKHAVAITGWGSLDGVEFWQIRNTYGNSFGFDGYFWVAMSRVDNQQYWVGPDIPNYFPYWGFHDSAAYFINPKDIDNLDELLANGILKKVT